MSLAVAGTSTRYIYARGNIQPFTGVSILDSLIGSSGGITIVTITVTDVNGGTPTDADGTFSKTASNGTGSQFLQQAPGVYTYTSSGSAASTVNSRLAGLVFQPSATPSTALFRLDVADSFNQTAADFQTSVVNAIPPTNFTIADQTTGLTLTSAGTGYTGPVLGLRNQYAVQDNNPTLTPHNLNITAVTPNVFIHGGSGQDGIDVSRANGNNVLDGSTGSNFLTGGTGNDNFYLDNRNPDSPVLSTIVNFHPGDNATVFGVNATDFKTVLLENQGAPGYRGVDVIFTAPGHIDTSFILAGYTIADLTNGRLYLSYGKTQDIPGLPGSEYFTVHGN